MSMGNHLVRRGSSLAEVPIALLRLLGGWGGGGHVHTYIYTQAHRAATITTHHGHNQQLVTNNMRAWEITR